MTKDEFITKFKEVSTKSQTDIVNFAKEFLSTIFDETVAKSYIIYGGFDDKKTVAWFNIQKSWSITIGYIIETGQLTVNLDLTISANGTNPAIHIYNAALEMYPLIKLISDFNTSNTVKDTEPDPNFNTKVQIENKDEHGVIKATLDSVSKSES